MSNVLLYYCLSALFKAIEKYIKSGEKATGSLKHIKIVNIKPDINVDAIKFFNSFKIVGEREHIERNSKER